MEIINKSLMKYADEHTSKESPLLHKINRETHLEVLHPRMLSGPLQGRTLSMLSTMIRPKHILEIGTYTGYSALCLAEGLQEDGTLFTIDVNHELEDRVRKYFAQSEFEQQIDYRIGNALNVIPEIKVELDMVFIDADKVNYSKYYDLIFDKIPKGGFIIADNVLWSGKVVEVNSKKDEDTSALIAFNDKVQNDKRVSNVLLPIRDGLMVIKKNIN